MIAKGLTPGNGAKVFAIMRNDLSAARKNRRAGHTVRAGRESYETRGAGAPSGRADADGCGIVTALPGGLPFPWPGSGVSYRARAPQARSGLGVPSSSRPASWPQSPVTPAPPVPPPAVRRTGERGVVMALPGRTPRSPGTNRVSGERSHANSRDGRDGRDGRASRGDTVPVCRDNAHRGPGESAGGRVEPGLAGPLRVVGHGVPQPPSTGVNATSTTRRPAEQA